MRSISAKICGSQYAQAIADSRICWDEIESPVRSSKIASSVFCRGLRPSECALRCANPTHTAGCHARYWRAFDFSSTGLGGISGLTKLPTPLFDCATDGMIATESLGDYRSANRRVATIEACEAAASAETAERDQKRAAVIVNAEVLARPATT
jgi:hypothetical protein